MDVHVHSNGILDIPAVVLYIFQYLSIKSIISCRRINKHFDHIIAFDITCIDGQATFRYNYKCIENIIINEMVSTIKGLVGCYFQILHLSISTTVWYFDQQPSECKHYQREI